MNQAHSGFINPGDTAFAGFTHNHTGDTAANETGDTADPALLDGGH